MTLDVNKIQAVIFDIDGTLSDSDDRMVQKLARFLTPIIRNENTRRSLARWLVMSAESPGNFIYNLADRFSLDSVFMRLISKFTKGKKHHVKQYWMIEGVAEMLAALPEIPLGIVSARDQRTTLAFLRQFEMEQIFGVIVTSQTCEYTKPFPDPLLYAAQKLGVLPENCLMVGDTTVDIKAAQAAGMQSVGVLCGFGREKELRRAGADIIIQTTAELASLFS